MEGLNLHFEDITKIKFVSSQYAQLDNSYLFARLKPGRATAKLFTQGPVRFSGMLFTFLHHGKIDIEVNFEHYVATDNTLIIMPPGTLFSLNDNQLGDIDSTVIFLNNTFLQEININPSAIHVPPLAEKRSPVYKLSRDQSDVIDKYLDLFYLNSQINTNHRLMGNIANNMISAIFYQLLQFLYDNLDRIEDKPSSRRSNYVSEFLKLVHIYYNSERSVTFYANKLFISPKYLSLLVKEATGKTAARIIDEFVILEAKNMLRFSGKNIQQVAYALNFSNQSAFGKYFKHLTGMSPTDYQHS